MLQRTTVNVLISDTGRLFLLTPRPCPALSHCLPLPLSLGVTGSDREQMLHYTATTEPDTATRTLPFCHLLLLNVLVSLEDICRQIFVPVTLIEEQRQMKQELDLTQCNPV